MGAAGIQLSRRRCHVISICAVSALDGHYLPAALLSFYQVMADHRQQGFELHGYTPPHFEQGQKADNRAGACLLHNIFHFNTDSDCKYSLSSS